MFKLALFQLVLATVFLIVTARPQEEAEKLNDFSKTQLNSEANGTDAKQPPALDEELNDSVPNHPDNDSPSEPILGLNHLIQKGKEATKELLELLNAQWEPQPVLKNSRKLNSLGLNSYLNVQRNVANAESDVELRGKQGLNSLLSKQPPALNEDLNGNLPNHPDNDRKGLLERLNKQWEPQPVLKNSRKLNSLGLNSYLNAQRNVANVESEVELRGKQELNALLSKQPPALDEDLNGNLPNHPDNDRKGRLERLNAQGEPKPVLKHSRKLNSLGLNSYLNAQRYKQKVEHRGKQGLNSLLSQLDASSSKPLVGISSVFSSVHISNLNEEREPQAEDLLLALKEEEALIAPVP